MNFLIHIGQKLFFFARAHTRVYSSALDQNSAQHGRLGDQPLMKIADKINFAVSRSIQPARRPVMKRKSLKSLVASTSLALLFMGALTNAAWASDDSALTLSTNNGTTKFSVQNSALTDIFLVNSAGSVQVTSNTVLQGTTFYQSGNAVIGAASSSLGFFGVTPVAQQGSGQNLLTALTNYGFYPAGSNIPFNLNNAALSGVTSLSMNSTLTGITSETMSGLMTTYDNLGTKGMGLGTVVAFSSQTAQTASIGTGTLNYANTPPSGAVLVINYYMVMTVGGGASNSTVGFTWTDTSGTGNGTYTSPNLLSTTAGTYIQGTVTIETNGSAIKYLTTYGGNGTYSMYVTMMRIL